MDTTKLVPLAITAAALYAVWKFGTPEMKGAALGVAGLIAINQVPVVRDGVTARLVA